jgi:hypothetical protein
VSVDAVESLSTTLPGPGGHLEIRAERIEV